jgi:U3 small nucleolar RNA-associated protein 12
LEPLYVEGTELYTRDPIYLGSIQRAFETRVLNIKFDPTGNLFALHGDSNIIEVFKKRSEKEMEKKSKSKEKRKKEKQEKKKEDEDSEEEEEDQRATIEFTRLGEVRAKEKIRSFDFHPTETGKNFRIVVGTLRNTVEEYQFDSKQQKEKSMIERFGHGTPIRSLSIASDDLSVASVSNGQCKIWSVEHGTCVRSIECGNGFCCLYLPGNNHVAIGTKTGEIEIYEISSMNLIEKVSAHESTVNMLILSPDKNGIISGGDKTVKFWSFELILDPEYSKVKICFI